MTTIEDAMRVAIEEARKSLREGNHGFGAVVLRGGEIVAAARDREESEQDPTSHAETNAIRAAARGLGRTDLSGCALVSTHEPCPMCASAIAWSGMRAVAYGCSIARSLEQGRRRMGIPCSEVFERAGIEVALRPDVLPADCETLYREDVRAEVERLRGADDERLRAHDADSTERRLAWFEEHERELRALADDPVQAAYLLILRRFGIRPEEAPVASRDARRLVFESRNFCPTLEACKILDLDTRRVCGPYNEGSTDALIKRIDPRLRFGRNYGRLRPYADCCEESITLCG